jgi:hypothetical protein
MQLRTMWSRSYFTTDGQSVSTSWYRAPLWDLQPDITSCRNVVACIFIRNSDLRDRTRQNCVMRRQTNWGMTLLTCLENDLASTRRGKFQRAESYTAPILQNSCISAISKRRTRTRPRHLLHTWEVRRVLHVVVVKDTRRYPGVNERVAWK